MYASVIGLYALKQDTNADIADAFALFRWRYV
jgi:hypothetical protein